VSQWTLIRHVHVLRLKVKDKRPAYQRIRVQTQVQAQGRAQQIRLHAKIHRFIHDQAQAVRHITKVHVQALKAVQIHRLIRLQADRVRHRHRTVTRLQAGQVHRRRHRRALTALRAGRVRRHQAVTALRADRVHHHREAGHRAAAVAAAYRVQAVVVHEEGNIQIFNFTGMNTRIVKWLIILLLVSTVVSVEAQTTDELLQLGTQEIQGTARFTGLGGAFNALGGDFGSLSTNPAGIGIYRSSEFVISPSLTLNNATTNFRGESLSDNRTRFGLANLGYVSTYLTQKSEGLISVNFGIGYNKSANFYKRTSLRGYDSPNSVLKMFSQHANNLKLNPDYLKGEFEHILSEDWTTAMALYSEMISYGNNNEYFSNGLDDNDEIDIYSSTLQSGSTNEYTFSFGGNISNKFQFGLTIGLQDLELVNNLNYNEKYVKDLSGVVDKYISSLRDEYTRTVGFGVNAKFGVIYRPIDAFRLGFAVHTPTFFNMERKYQVYMNSLYKTTDGNDDFREESPQNPELYEYTLTTPYRLEFGLAYIFGKAGLISIDYELVGNPSMRISDNILDDTDYIPVRNNAIKNSYRNTSNVRVGGEINLPRGLMLRAGFNYFQSPYKDSSLDFDRYAYSAGFGYRSKYFFVDLAYTMNTGKYHFAPYYVNDYRVRDTDNYPDIAVENLKIGRIIASIGFKF
jgi:hypothetical protein